MRSPLASSISLVSAHNYRATGIWVKSGSRTNYVPKDHTSKGPSLRIGASALFEMGQNGGKLKPGSGPPIILTGMRSPPIGSSRGRRKSKRRLPGILTTSATALEPDAPAAQLSLDPLRDP